MKAMIVLLMALLPGFASSQEASVDQALVRGCFEAVQAAGDLPACVGEAARLCQARPGGDTTLGISECLMAETAVWADFMQEAYLRQRELLGQTNAALVAQLEAAQRAWVAYNEAECSLRYAIWIDGSIRVIVAGDCHLRKTAARARELAALGVMD